MYYGSAAHAEQVTYGRHPAVKDALQWLTFAHLPAPLQRFSRPFYGAACEVVETILTDSPELTTSLNTIINAKDAAVRAGIRHDTGRAGSVPRPQKVTEPPRFETAREILDPPSGVTGAAIRHPGPPCTCNYNGMSGGHATDCPQAVF